jgi:hypothetical protein
VKRTWLLLLSGARSPFAARRSRSGLGFFLGSVTPDQPTHGMRETWRMREAFARGDDQFDDFILLPTLTFGWHGD